MRMAHHLALGHAQGQASHPCGTTPRRVFRREPKHQPDSFDEIKLLFLLWSEDSATFIAVIQPSPTKVKAQAATSTASLGDFVKAPASKPTGPAAPEAKPTYRKVHGRHQASRDEKPRQAPSPPRRPRPVLSQPRQARQAPSPPHQSRSHQAPRPSPPQRSRPAPKPAATSTAATESEAKLTETMSSVAGANLGRARNLRVHAGS